MQINKSSLLHIMRSHFQPISEQNAPEHGLVALHWAAGCTAAFDTSCQGWKASELWCLIQNRGVAFDNVLILGKSFKAVMEGKGKDSWECPDGNPGESLRGPKQAPKCISQL